MKRFFVWVVFLPLYFIVCSDFSLVAQNPAVDKNSQKKIEKKINALNSTLKVISEQQKDFSLERNIEEKIEEIYEKKHKNSDDILLHGQWIVAVVLGIFTIFFGFLAYFSYRSLAIKAESEILVIRDKAKEAKEAVNVLEREIENVKTNVEKKIKYDVKRLIKRARAKSYYDIAVSSIIDEKYGFALEFLLPLHKSNYRLNQVCYHIGFCYKNIKEYSKALIFFEEAKGRAEDENMAIIVTKIQSEIEEIQQILKEID